MNPMRFLTTMKSMTKQKDDFAEFRYSQFVPKYVSETKNISLILPKFNS